ncbi:alpha/beta-hydrolase [Xylariomycetidae sp. FL2044]|nr:alpha/beta-hydrolase [Xylariomycetidae sp. FL2044]
MQQGVRNQLTPANVLRRPKQPRSRKFPAPDSYKHTAADDIHVQHITYTLFRPSPKSMDQLKQFGRSIDDVLMPTFGAYADLLKAKAVEIRSTRHETHQYGDHERQLLDVYYPEKAPVAPFNDAEPVLAFFYGGGFVGGDRVNRGYADGLIFGNIGHFFASEYGITVVVVDYRLIAHGAKYPSGGEDVQRAVEWIGSSLVKKAGYESIDLFLLGNSAGGVHVATYLLDGQFAASRAKVLAEARAGPGALLRGGLFLGVPFHWGSESNGILTGYFGEGKKLWDHSPLGLLEAAKKKKKQGGPELPGVGILIQMSELDVDMFIETAREFQQAWPGRSTVEFQILEGHNHISPQLGLATGIEKEEQWGRQVAVFLQSRAS